MLCLILSHANYARYYARMLDVYLALRHHLALSSSLCEMIGEHQEKWSISACGNGRNTAMKSQVPTGSCHIDYLYFTIYVQYIQVM